MSKAYHLKSGISFNTPAEVDGYIRGLELARLTIQAERTEKSGLDKIAGFLDEAHTVKAAGKTEQ